MALPLYILSVVGSSSVVGAVARKILQSLGFVPSLEAGLALTFAVAFAFAAVQVAFVAFTRLAAPSRGGVPLFFESLSNAAAVVYLPYLAGLSVFPLIRAAVPSSAAIISQTESKLGTGVVEALMLGGVFLTIHAVLKLIAFFSATESRPASRLYAFVWAGVAVLLCSVALASLRHWAATLGHARQVPLADAKRVSIDGAYAEARELPLGAEMTVPIDGHTGHRMMLRWALAREYPLPPTQLYVTVQVDDGAPFQRTVALATEGWTECRPFAEPLPADAKQCRISWGITQPSSLALKWGLLPPPSTRDTVWVAGPTFAAPVNARENPSIILLSIDGLTSARLKSQGYSRDTMPVLDNLAKNATFFPTAVTPSPEVPAAVMSMLTGRSPLVHGFLGKRMGPLPESVPLLQEQLRTRHYATAAFTEADWGNRPDLGVDSAFARGFEHFDPTTPMNVAGRGSLPGAPAPPEHAGSSITLERAAAWAEARSGDRFFLFVRLREAGAPAALPRYGEGFIRNRAEPDPGDVYDTALNAVDKALPVFLDRLKAKGVLDSTLLVITSPGGIETARASAVTGGVPLTEQTTMVPLILADPGKSGATRSGMVSLEDLAGTLAQSVTPTLDGFSAVDLRDFTAGNEAVSISGDPLVLSLRNRRWRFTWDSGVSPFSREARNTERVLSMLNIELTRARGSMVDDLARQPDEATRNRARLVQYLERNILPGTP